MTDARWSILASAAGVPLVTGLFTLVAVVLTVGLTYIFTKKREHENDWRGVKLAHYTEYVKALSGIVGARGSPDAQAAYADAVNALTLIAPPTVMVALYAFQDEISYRNAAKRTDARHDYLLGEVLRAMRRDIHPSVQQGESKLTFRFLEPPPNA